MLQHPQNPNMVDSQGRSALVAASQEGHVEILCLLLEAGADKNMRTTDGDTALILAPGKCIFTAECRCRQELM